MSREVLDRVSEWERALFASTGVVQEYVFERTGFCNVLVWCDDTLVSFLTTLRREALFDGWGVILGGVSSVVTPLEHRRKGYASLALQEAERIIFDEIGADCGAVLCEEQLVPFYSRRGWHTITCPVEIAQPGGKTVWPERMMVLAKRDVVWRPLTVDLCGLPF
jgi:predicted acetyltransferase